MKVVAIVAIVSLTVLEGIALWTGTDGTLLSVIAAIIGGLGGYTIKEAKGN